MKWANLIAVCALATPAFGGNIELGPPIACTFGVDCWIQQYADHDPSKSAHDYACGHETYDGHDGTDFRILRTASRAYVVASANGTVKALRDGMVDQLVETDSDRMRVKDHECGNGVVIDHADGWQTQYCHLRKGSVTVKIGDQVAQGDRLGEVGFSGMAAFPHVHLTVRHNNEVRDPFGGKPDGSEPCGKPADVLWNQKAAQIMVYHGGDIIDAAFYPKPISLADLEVGGDGMENLAAAWSAIVASVWAINLTMGDEITVSLQGPGGIAATNSATLDHDKAQFMLFAGKKRPSDGWPPGTYGGSATISRDGKIVLQRAWQQEMR
jgi:hypothetical protein